MRRVFAAWALIAVAVVTGGCSTEAATTPSAWSSPGTDTTSGVAASTPDVCARIRSVISADMTPLGKALGSMIGYGIGNDSDDRRTAQAKATAQLKAVGTDISRAASNAADPALRTAAASAAKNVEDLAGDPTFLSGITSLSDVTSVTGKLATATQPIAEACG